MDEAVQKLIAQTAAGEVSLAQALAQAAVLTGQVADIGCARIDHGRTARCGFPEFYRFCFAVQSLARVNL